MPRLKTNCQFALNNGCQSDQNSFLPITNISISVYHFWFIGLAALLVIFFPVFWLLIIMPLTIISLLLVGFPFDFAHYFSFHKQNLVVPVLKFLAELNILKFFITLYSLVFYTITKVYLFFCLFCYGLTLLYMLVSRYYFYHKFVLREEFSLSSIWLICLLLFIGFCGSYLRILINVSIIIVAATRQYMPELLDPLLRVEPPDLPSGSNKSLFSFSYNNHNHHYPPQPKTTTWGRLGIFVALGGVVISGATYYHMQRQTYEFTRQNDLEELSQGLITKEEYQERHK